MVCKVKSTWAIRDIEHGKTFYFSSFDEMLKWINSRGESYVGS